MTLKHIVIAPLEETRLGALEDTFPGKRHRDRLLLQASGKAVYLVASEDDTPAGHVLLKLPDGSVSELARREGCGEIEDLFVSERFRRKGIGRGLMVQAEEEARARGVSKLGLGVETDNEAALGLYRVLGYKDAGHGVFIESGQLADGTAFVLIETYLTKTLGPGLIWR